jgi:hypothetical protein
MPSARTPGLVWPLFALLVGATGCDTIVSIAAQGGDFAGATADVHCDRRYVSDGGQPAAFCQEVVSTLAASQFADDCRLHLLATPGQGLCPRDRIIAGCKLLKQNADNSQVWDWYYDVSNIEAEAGADDGPDGGPTFVNPPESIADVAHLCADPTRYQDGADLVTP